jgi:aspartyl-tRNA(Asn)/glutamyl-tRNA(Gln) amidotransferase subunit A
LSLIDGIPVSVKDNFCLKGFKTSAGSRILKDFISPYDSTLSTKLKNNGAIIISKTNLDEFGTFFSDNRNGKCQLIQYDLKIK